LPATDEVSGGDLNLPVQDELRSLVGEGAVADALTLVAQARFRTRMRIEPILQEMDKYLDSFNVGDD
jgi:hypothetical protein